MNTKGKLLLVLILVAAILGAGFLYAREQERAHTPQYALEQAAKVFTTRDMDLLARYVDYDTFMTKGYDEGAALVSSHIYELHDRYPADPFFNHTPEFMTEYAAMNREAAIACMKKAFAVYGGGPYKDPDFDTERPQWLATQANRLPAYMNATIQSVDIQGPKAKATVHFHGDSSPAGRLIGDLDIVFDLEEQDDGIWQIKRIANGEELLIPMVDRAEIFWELQGWNN